MPPRKQKIDIQASSNLSLEEKDQKTIKPQEIERRMTRGRIAAQQAQQNPQNVQSSIKNTKNEKNDSQKQNPNKNESLKRLPKQKIPTKKQEMPSKKEQSEGINKKGDREIKQNEENPINISTQMEINKIDNILDQLPPEQDQYKQKLFRFQDINSESAIHIRKLNAEFGGGQMGSRDSSNITKAIIQCINLEELDYDLGINYIDQRGAFAISAILGKLQKIKKFKLELYDNSIGSGGAGAFDRCLEKWSNTLEEIDLNLSDNQIGRDGTFNFGQGIAKCSKLKSIKLNFCSNQLKEKDVLMLMSGISQINKLETFLFKVNYCGINNKSCASIGEGLSKLKYLQNLNLSIVNSQINQEGLTDLFINLSKCPQLSIFDLEFQGQDNIEPEGIKRFARELSKFPLLSDLKLNFSSEPISEDQFIALITEIGKCALLKNLFLEFDQTNISNKGIQLLTEGLSKLIGLEKLSLYLQFEQGCYQKFCYCLQKLESLKQYDYFSNITSSEVQQINYSQMKNLSTLKQKFLGQEIDNNCISILGREIAQINLNSIDLEFQDCNISKEGIEQFGKKLQEMKNLKTIKIKFLNSLKDNESSLLFASYLSKCDQLMFLNIQIDLSQEDQSQFYKNITLCQNLIDLNIRLSHKNDKQTKQRFSNQIKKKCLKLLKYQLSRIQVPPTLLL